MKTHIRVGLLVAVLVVPACGGSISRPSGAAKPKGRPAGASRDTAKHNLAIRSYQVGECIRWPQGVAGTGLADISTQIAHAPATHELDAFLGPTCGLLAAQYLGRALDGDLASSWLPLDPRSWSAGRRTIDCLVAHGPAGQHRAVSGSIRSGA